MIKGAPEGDPPSGPASVGPLDTESSNNSSEDPGWDGLALNGEGFTIDEALNSLGLGKFQWLLMLYVGMAWFGDAMEMMLLSFLSPEVSRSRLNGAI